MSACTAAHLGNHHRRQNADDGDDQQHLDEGEAIFDFRFSIFDWGIPARGAASEINRQFVFDGGLYFHVWSGVKFHLM
jgi:hypothetical protein